MKITLSLQILWNNLTESQKFLDVTLRTPGLLIYLQPNLPSYFDSLPFYSKPQCPVTVNITVIQI